MYKDMHNKILSLPKGKCNPWVNFFWMMVFSPFFVLLGAYVILIIYAVGGLLIKWIFGI